jgi:hypothetical protein
MQTDSQADSLDVLWGADAIGVYLNVPRRRAFYLLERGFIPARKIGATWQSTKGELRDHLIGGKKVPVAVDEAKKDGSLSDTAA